MLKRWAALSPGIRWLAGIAAAVLALAFLWALFVPVADWLAHHDVGSATETLHETALDNVRGRLLTLGAGLLAAAALIFTARNFTLSRRTFELTEQGQVTDRYTKAIEQLGSDKLDVRIGAIYALERIARDSARDHPTVIEVLAAFIREHSREQWPEPEPGGRAQERSTRPDVQAALTAVGRRDARHDSSFRRIDLSRANLRDANLRDANLARADLPRADLTGADLTGADLAYANLIRANLHEVNLTYTHLDFADLREADLTGAYGGSAILTDAILAGADLTGAYMGDDVAHAALTGARWPEGTSVPEGWKLDTDSRRLQPDPDPGRRFGRKAAGDDSPPAETN
jgi:hypothetical protein